MVRKIKLNNKKVNNETIEFNKKIGKMKNDNSIKECLWIDKRTCRGKIISAHSIQNNRFLKKISKDGKIFTFDFEIDGDLKSIFKEKGRKTFSTFTGFCQKHDKELFQPIEDTEYKSTEKQKYLFAFRSLAKDFHTKKEVLNFQRALFKEMGFNPQILAIITNLITDLEDLSTDFKKMSDEIQNKTYSGLKTREIILEKEYPIVTNSSFIPYYNSENKNVFKFDIYEKIQNGDLGPTIFLNIFPKDGKTYILMSYFETYESLLLPFLNDFDDNLEEKISIMILRHCENTAFNPDYIENNFLPEEKDDILENFKSNIGITSTPLNLKTNLFR